MSATTEAGHHTNYVKIWGILVGLLTISVIGPMFNVRWLTLITAFGIALVKAFLVAKHFMHITMEKRWVTWMLLTMLALMLIMFFGVAPDVLKHDGWRWENTAAKQWVEKGEKEGKAQPAEHNEAHEGL